MSRISIDVTPQEHQRLKALAALQGMSIKQFVLESTLGARSDGAVGRDLAELEALLDQRTRAAETQGLGRRTVGDIFRQARGATGSDLDA